MVAMSRSAHLGPDHPCRPEGSGCGVSQSTSARNRNFFEHRDCCIHELVEKQAERTPDAIAVVEGDRRLTYRDLNSQANRLAAYLRGRGIGPEVPVAICLKRSTNLMVSMFAVLKAGGACVPLDPAYPAERLEFMLQDTRAALLLTQDELLPSRVTNTTEMIDLPITWGMINQESADQVASGVSAKGLAYIIYTSGSKGRSGV